jgi:hypothetical protein
MRAILPEDGEIPSGLAQDTRAPPIDTLKQVSAGRVRPGSPLHNTLQLIGNMNKDNDMAPAEAIEYCVGQSGGL